MIDEEAQKISREWCEAQADKALFNEKSIEKAINERNWDELLKEDSK